MGICGSTAGIFLLLLIKYAFSENPMQQSKLETINVTKSACELKETFLGRKKIFTCTNVTSEYLESHAHKTNRSEWFHCDSCTLTAISAKTLNQFEPKNRILYLNISACQVSTISDFAFSELPNLKLLLLRDNRISDLNDMTFQSLRRLLQLDLSRNQLVDLKDDTFVQLQVLDILNLNWNQLQNLQPRTFAGLKELKYLYLSFNEIANIHPYLFKDLINLRILYLEHNRIKEISPLAFTNLHKLIYLYLNHNSIDFLSEYNFKELSELVDLQMRQNSLKEIPTSSFNGLRKLKFLYLGDNNISTLSKHAFTGLDSLTILDLTNNSLPAFLLDFLVDMPELRGLWLENNVIETLVIEKSSKKHRNLASFDLKANKLDYFNYKILLRKLECLEEMYVGDNRWKCEFFVPMYDYFEESNVTLCLDSKCDKNDTIWYTETLCKLSYNDTSDEVMSNHAHQKYEYNSFIIIYLHLIMHCIVYLVLEK